MVNLVKFTVLHKSYRKSNMNVLDARVNYNEQYDNLPNLEILVDKIPKNLVYLDRHPFYFVEKDGYVEFLYYEKPGEGYGGRTFNIITNKGQKSLIGPWSSRSSIMNKEGFTLSKECKIAKMSDENTIKNWILLYSAHITLELFENILKRFDTGFYLDYIDHDDDIKFPELAKKGMTFRQSQSFKRSNRILKIIKNWNKDEKLLHYNQGYWNDLYHDYIRSYNNLITENKLQEFGLNTI